MLGEPLTRDLSVPQEERLRRAERLLSRDDAAKWLEIKEELGNRTKLDRLVEIYADSKEVLAEDVNSIQVYS